MEWFGFAAVTIVLILIFGVLLFKDGYDHGYGKGYADGWNRERPEWERRP